ncbi:helix-turn-helix domain-containing protein [Streptomyces sp. NPDC048484]|uniref:helix-turn-helix domain-containing protein n=1 Tax=Streptomyces sp. NPDC048484 TaxID=3155146 RepID=UPI00343B71B5
MTTANDCPASPVTPLRQARERFLKGLPLPDGVPDEVVAAWRRARFFGVPHDLRESARPERSAESALLTAARPVLERLAPALNSGQSALVLTDERLRVLWSGGNAPAHEQCRDLSEREVGHNSAARALRERRRAEVHGPEHFLDLWQDVSAVSVPVLAPESGRALGTVTVASGLYTDCSQHPGAALAEATATAVEAELLTRSRTAERVLLDAYQRAACRPRAAVVALDGRNRLLSEAAAGLLSPEAVEVLERSAAANGSPPGRPFPEPEAPGGSLCRPAAGDGAEPVAHEARPVGYGAGPVAYELELPDGVGTARVTQVRHENTVIGVVAVLEPPVGGDARPTVQPRVTLAGHSVPWRHATTRAAELARSREPLLLTGERGTGKTTLAREVQAARNAPPPLVLDAAERTLGELNDELNDELDGECDRQLDRERAFGDHHGWLEALTGGRVLLLRHAERLAQPDIASLNSLLDEHPHAPLLVTYTPGDPPGPCLQRLLDTLAARSVTLPALRERPEDIRELLPRLAPRPAPGEPPLTWTLDALHALERHPWPGNVTELAHVVRALAKRRRTTGPVRRAELPDPVREGPAERPLSPMEHAERTAILEALRSHGGNKARAAAALGIARATLYRKLRGYRS